jgi:hypothetical protein
MTHLGAYDSSGPLRHQVLSYFVAIIAAVYGFAKLNGAQFTILDSQLDHPLRDVSGFWLVWYFFGYSRVYGSLIALIQIAAGLCLTFPATQFAAAMVLVPIFVNIVLIDIFFSVGPEGLVPAVATLVAVLAILNSYRASLLAFFFPRGFASFEQSVSIRALATRALILAAAAGFTYWVANYNNRAPTVLDGTWRAEAMKGTIDPEPAKVFLERNRANMCVIRTRRGEYLTRHFEISPETHSIKIWQKWLTKGHLLFDGEYILSDDELILRGIWSGKPVELRLRREKQRL